VDFTVNQHTKWLKTTASIPWRKPIASLNDLLTSHVWREDHNGVSHQDPGFIDRIANKQVQVVRIYLTPDANCLSSVVDIACDAGMTSMSLLSVSDPNRSGSIFGAAARHGAA
jgi:xylulose-5-phosphate/fructose-6-phosphate phosphoketolase